MDGRQISWGKESTYILGFRLWRRRSFVKQIICFVLGLTVCLILLAIAQFNDAFFLFQNKPVVVNAMMNLALIKTKQEAHYNKFGSYIDAANNPSSVPTKRGELLEWNPNAPGWKGIDFQHETQHVQFQYRMESGSGRLRSTCKGLRGPHPAVCAGLASIGAWYWVSAENADFIVITNGAHPSVWVLQKN